MSSAISSSSDTMNGCGLLHAFKRFLKLRYIRTISTGKASRRQPHPTQSLPQIQQTTLAASSLHKSSPGFVRGPFVANQKLYVAAAPTSLHNIAHLKNGMEMMKKVKNETNEERITKRTDGMINKLHIPKGKNSLVRATSGNVMIYGHLGNLGGLRGQNICSAHVMDFLPMTAKEAWVVPNTYNSDNENNKNGRYNKALGSNDSVTLNNASFRINTIGALVTSGEILEAVHECRRALRIDPRFKEANHLLANLYIRLGEAEKAVYHYKHARLKDDSVELLKAKALQEHLQKCTEAKKRRDWNSIIKETDSAIKSGATCSPQIFSLQAEAYLKLRKHEDADGALSKATQFTADACKKFYGPIGSANLLRVKAQVDMASGRFDDALEAARKAEQLDPKSREVNMVVQKALATAQARLKGNELFRESKYSEAYEAYEEGLDHDPHNSVLLCNRAACLFKLGHYQRAAKDCSAALSLRPSYDRARLRRADCNAKMGKWEASINDYKVLLQKTPEDEEVRRQMSRAEFQLNRQRIRDATRQNLNSKTM